MTKYHGVRRIGEVARNTTGILGIITTFLQSVFVFGGSLSLLGGVFLLIYGLMSGRRNAFRLFLGCTVAVLVIFAISTTKGLPLVEIMKSSIGMFLFFITLHYGAHALLYMRWSRAAVLLVSVCIQSSFIAEYLGILSLKELGVVSWFETASYQAQFDARASGLFSEPSWFALSGAAILFYLRSGHNLFTWVILSSQFVMVLMSGSAIGLLYVIISMSFAVTFVIRRLAYSRHYGILMIALGLIILLFINVPIDGPGLDNQSLQKLVNPLEWGSGISRFLDPLPYVRHVWMDAPFTGYGLSYLSERLMGATGLAILPLNVFMEIGFLGVAYYIMTLMLLFYRYRSDAPSIVSCVACMFSLGLPYSPFQAILLALFIVGGARK